MSSHPHEVLIEMFHHRPELATKLLGDPLHVTLPDFICVEVSSDLLAEVARAEYQADVVITLIGLSDVVLAVVVDVQLRIDPRKERDWPARIAALREQLGCPVVLLAVCLDRAVAAWCATPLAVGDPDLELTPIVLGPDQIPVTFDRVTARCNPELAVLSALAHGAETDPASTVETLISALDRVDRHHGDLYLELVFAMRSPAARRDMEALMATACHRRVLVENLVDMLMTILDARGIETPHKVLSHVARCTDPDQVRIWIRRAATVHKIQDVDERFAP